MQHFTLTSLGASCALILACAAVAGIAAPHSTAWQYGDDASAPTGNAPIRAPLDIVRATCLACHCEDGNTPIIFHSISKLRRSAPTAIRLLTDKAMPPWLPTQADSCLSNPLTISDSERSALIAWFGAGCPTANDEPEPILCQAAAVQGSEIRFAADWEIIANAEGTVRTFVAAYPPDAPERIRGWALSPVEHSALESVLLSCDTTGRARELDAMDGATGSALYGDTQSSPAGSLGRVTADPATLLPEGYCYRIPKGADLVAETHPRNLGRPAKGAFSVIVKPALPSDREVTALLVAATSAADGLRRTGEFVDIECDPLDKAVDLIAVSPRPGMRCKTLSLCRLTSGGTREQILLIPHYRTWADRTYTLCAPLRLATGDRLILHIEHEEPYWAAKALGTATLFVVDATTSAPEPIAPCLTTSNASPATQFRPAMVCVPPQQPLFVMSSTEVTRAQFRAAIGSSIPGETPGDSPEVMVSWFDGVEYCNRLSTIEGIEPYYFCEVLSRDLTSRIRAAVVTIRGGCGYRLPTEGEWEFGARAGGNGFASPEFAWCADNSLDALHAVGTRTANGWGLSDMSGNVWEWCGDGWIPTRTAADSSAAPLPGTNLGRAMRGGCFADSLIACQTGFRAGLPAGTRSPLVGLRIVKSCPR